MGGTVSELGLAEALSRLEAEDAAIFVGDTAGTIIHWSPEAQLLLGWTPEEARGRRVVHFLIDERDVSLTDQATARAAAGKPTVGSARLRVKGGDSEWIVGFVVPWRDNAGEDRVAVLAAPGRIDAVGDVSPQVDPAVLDHLSLRAYERAARRAASDSIETLRRIQSVTMALGRSIDLADVTAQVVKEGVAATGATSGVVLLRTPDNTFEVAATRAVPSGILDTYRVAAEAGEGPVHWVFSIAEPVWLASQDEVREHWPALFEAQRRSAAFLPLVIGDEVEGVLALHFMEERTFGGPDRTYLLTLADVCAQSLSRALTYARAEADSRRLLASERDARREAEEAIQRLGLLQALTAALSEAVGLEAVVRVAIDIGRLAVGAERGSAALLDEGAGRLRVVHAQGYTAEAVRAFGDFDLGDANPLATATRERRVVICEDRTAIIEQFPSLEAHLTPETAALVAIPLVCQDGAIGGMGFSFTEARAFREDDEAFLAAIGQQVAEALNRAALYEEARHARERLEETAVAERKARQAAEESQRRLMFLAEASAVLGASIDYEGALQRVADLAVPTVADWCSVLLAQPDGTYEQAGMSQTDERRRAVIEQLLSRYPVDPDAPAGSAAVIRTGVTEWYPEVSSELLELIATDEEHLHLLRELAVSSAAVVPIVGRTRILGAINLMTGNGRRLVRDDVAMAEEVARRVALAVENAELFRSQKRVEAELVRTGRHYAALARTLQESLLPPHLPDAGRLELAARFRAGGEGLDVGGDFYDVLSLEPGVWAVFMGDVCGKGAPAARLTALVRYTLRTAAFQHRDPVAVLTTLNEVMLHSLEQDQRPQTGIPDARFVTVAYGLVEENGGDGVRFRFACGGHELPFLVRESGLVERQGGPGTVLGVFPDIRLTETEVLLAPGDAAVLLTDGVIEADGCDLDTGESRVLDLLGRAAGGSADELAGALDVGILNAARDCARDDMAVLVMRVRD